MPTSECPRATVFVLVMALGGCATGHQPPRTARCLLTPGMGVDELALCGCVSADTRSDYHVPLGNGDDGGSVTRVAIVNYMCPLGSAGIARVVVKNGMALQIDY